MGPAVAVHQRDNRRHVAAGRVAADGDFAGVDTVFGRVVIDMLEGGPAVVYAVRVFFLRGERVVDVEDDAARQLGNQPAGVLDGVGGAADPAAAVEEDEGGAVFLVLGVPAVVAL